MLPWWFWVLLWLVLILATLLLAVLGAWKLYQSVMRLLRGMGEASDHISRQMNVPGTPVKYEKRTRKYPSGTKATHGDPEKIREKLEKGKAERIEARRIRRVERRRVNNQSQNVYDLKLF